MFQHQVRDIPDEFFLGSRNPLVEGAPYEWKTWAQVNGIVNLLAKGMKVLNLLPEISAEN
jgi:primosomal protein N'